MAQRSKEIVLLVLALAFLAVALFTIRGKREPVVPPPAPAVEEQAEATPAEPGTEPGEATGEQAAEEAGGVRNPFALPGTSAAAPVEPAEPGASPAGQIGEPTAAVAALPEGELRLTGIVAGLAVIRDGEKRHYVRAGDRIGDYQVQSVGQREVVLRSEAGQITLRTGGRQ